MKSLLISILMAFLSVHAMAQKLSPLQVLGLDPGVRANSPYFYYIAVLGRDAIDYNLPTHVVATGHGGPSAALFQHAAIGRAKKYAEVFQSNQVVMVVVNEFDGDINIKKLEAIDFRVVAAGYNKLSVDGLLQAMRGLRQIVSFDLFAHSNLENGAALDEDFLGPQNYEMSELARSFTAKSWAVLHGCNSGWSLAPALARMWQVPVGGSYTGTHFQRLHSGGEFYPHDVKQAPTGPWAPTNVFSFNQPVDCAFGGCERMHPDKWRYWGEWGDYKSGLGFYRFSCGGLRASDCEQRMALSLLGFIGKVNLHLGSSATAYLSVLKEYMCPINVEQPGLRLSCEQGIDQALASGDMTYTPFLSRSVVCNGDQCGTPSVGQTSIEFMKAVKGFLNGFALSKTSAKARQ